MRKVGWLVRCAAYVVVGGKCMNGNARKCFSMKKRKYSSASAGDGSGGYGEEGPEETDGPAVEAPWCAGLASFV